MAAMGSLPQPPSIWYTNFLEKVLSLELNVRQDKLCISPVCSFLWTSGVICLEEFVKGSMVARLSCLCSFHNGRRHRSVGCAAGFLILCCSMLVLLASAR
jgi:hypothetical protein